MKSVSKTNDPEINRIIQLMRTDKSFDAPADAIQWSKNIFRSRVAEPKKSIAEKILAILKMDLSPNRAAFGERSASASQARQMLFQASENSIDLRIKLTGKNFNLRGQVLGSGFANASVKLGEFETTTNEISEFVFASVPGGKYALSFQGREKEIVIADIEIG